MDVKAIVEAQSIHDLQSMGSYRDVKSHIEMGIGIKLGVQGWNSLFEKLRLLKEIIPEKKNYLLNICKQKDYKESKAEIADALTLNIEAKDVIDLNEKIAAIIDAFTSSSFDPYKYYEETKFKKFKDSSKLEGIDIEIPDENTTLESVLAKYKR